MSMQLPLRGRPALLLCAVTVTASIFPGPSAGQDSTSALRGLVVDSTAGMPLGGVLVRLDSGVETLTSAVGRFELTEVPSGPHMVALLTADCRVTWAEVDLEPGGVLDTRFTLASARDVEGRDARAERRRSQGEVVTGNEIRAMHLRSLAEVIRRIKPSMVGTSSAVGAVAPIRGRSRNSFSDDAMEPVVVVDGVRASDGSRMIHSIDPSDVARLELLPGSVAGWEYGSDGAAGVVRITTLSGRSVDDEPDTERCVVPDFPIG